MEENQQKKWESFEDDYNSSHWWSKMWMSWAVPFIKHVNKYKFLQDASQCPKMPENDNSGPTTARMERIMSEYERKYNNFDYKKNMLWIILKTFKFNIMKVVFWGVLTELIAVFNFWYSSFFVRWLQEDGENYQGYLYAISFAILFYTTQVLRVNYFFSSNYLGINLRKAIS